MYPECLRYPDHFITPFLFLLKFISVDSIICNQKRPEVKQRQVGKHNWENTVQHSQKHEEELSLI